MSAIFRCSKQALRISRCKAIEYGIIQSCSFHTSRRFFSEQTQLDPHVEDIINKIQNLNLLQVSELVTHLKSRLNIPDSALMGGGPMMMAAAPTEEAPAAVEEKEPEKTIFTVKMNKYDDNKKIAVIKEVRAIFGLGLKE